MHLKFKEYPVLKWLTSFFKVKTGNVELPQEFTPLKLKLHSSLSIDTTLLSISDEFLTAPIPYNVLQNLSVKSVAECKIYDKVRWIVQFNETMPDTGFQIYLEAIDNCFTVWFVLDEFYYSTPQEWSDVLDSLTVDTITECDEQYKRTMYIDKVQSMVVRAGDVTAPRIEHESVYHRHVDMLNGREYFKKIVVDGQKLQIAIGYDLTYPQFNVNF